LLLEGEDACCSKQQGFDQSESPVYNKQRIAAVSNTGLFPFSGRWRNA
jgi:hypothetical protein